MARRADRAPRRGERGASGSRYSLRFGTTAFLLISGTLVLVLFVLPQRYVLRPGFRESGMSFPDPSTPFAPFAVVPIAARVLPGPPPEILPGPAELFWEAVVPLVGAGRYFDALPVFEQHLLEHPADVDARREHATALLAAGRPAEAVEELRRLLRSREDAEQRLLLARTLRELGRTEDAAAEYATLAEASPDDLELVLEWAQAYAWAERYAEAEALLESALARDPSSVPLRVELARVYYSSGRLEDARALLSSVDDAALARAQGLTLRRDVLAALAVPEPVVPPLPTPLEQAVAAREADDFARALGLFEEAIAKSPDDPAIWQAYADLLEYELADFEGARSALLEVERLSTPDADLQYRLAQLEIWTGRTDEAAERLGALLAALDAGAEGDAVTRADVDAALGDLRRWEGDRVGAARRYELALEADADNRRALDGTDALEAEVARMLVELEGPRVGGSAYSLADTDDFARVDVAGEWVEVSGLWAWGGSAGNRWLSGARLDGADANRRGVYLDLESARWWRWGTLRTGLDFGVQRLRAAWDVSFGASLGKRGAAGSASELRYEHGPAYPVTVTLQSVLAEVVQDRLVLSHARPGGDGWNLSAALDAAWLRADPDSVATTAPASTGRIGSALSVGHSVSPEIALGFATRLLVFTRAAPVTLAGGGTRRLFWDPYAVVSVGPYAELSRDLATDWKVTGRLSPGFALIDERGPGSDLLPHVSAEAGIRHEGARYWTTLDAFYYQGQFDGYRTYGARLSLSARDFASLGGGP